MFQPLIAVQTPNKGKVTVASSSTLVLAANSGRTQLWICNTSNEAISVSFGSAAVLNEGITLNAGVSIVIETVMSTLPLYAICASGGKVLGYLEVTK